MKSNTPRTRQGLEEAITSRAYEDASFRQALQTNPKAALAKEFDSKIPDEVNVQVHEETARDIHVVIPAKPDKAEVQQTLSDRELEAVAGGADVEQQGTASVYLIFVDWECWTCQ